MKIYDPSHVSQTQSNDLKLNDAEITLAVNTALIGKCSAAIDSSTLIDVIMSVMQERQRQDNKWGEQNHPDFIQVTDMNTGESKGPLPLPSRFNFYGIPTEEDAKKDCDSTFKRGKGNWAHIFVEEVCEAIGTTSDAKLEEELIQCAAVSVAWVQAIRRRREQK